MPQIWLTYSEMGRFLNTSAEEARDGAIEARLDRRQCSDGHSRVKLPADMIDGYLLHSLAERSGVSADAEALDALADRLVGRLRQLAQHAGNAAEHRAS